MLHEVKNNEVGDVLLCGVLDGHGGTAASESVSKILPPLFSEELELSSDEDTSNVIATSLEKSWDLTCTTYRSLCENGECVVDYDQREGILYAETGSKDLIGERILCNSETQSVHLLLHITHCFLCILSGDNCNISCYFAQSFWDK